MLYLILGSFIVGCLVGALHYMKERKKAEKLMVEQILLHRALMETPVTEIRVLCESAGPAKAYKMILDNYCTKHDIKAGR